jgi:predicted DNA-binding protein (MmcQ/YjbR family)
MSTMMRRRAAQLWS